MPVDSKNSNNISINFKHQEQIGLIWRDRCSRRALNCVNNFNRAEHLRQLASGAELPVH